MKKFLKKLGRVLFFLTFIFFVVAGITTTSILILKNNEYVKTTNDYLALKSKLDETSKGLDQTSQENKNTINSLNNQIEGLKSKNAELQTVIDDLKKNGEGIISGKITGQIILGQDNLSQFQLICAKDIAIVNQIYCKSVSALSQTFEISLPAGKYLVYAKVLDKDNQVVLNDYSGKYTEYVKCLTEKATEGCDVALSRKQIEIEVKPTQKVANVNPVDWN